MPDSEFHRVRRPNGDDVPDKSSSRGKIQRGMLTIVVGVVGPLVLGGVVAEIFHTGQAIANAILHYQAETDLAAKKGLDLLTSSVNDSLKRARIAGSEGAAETEQINASMLAEVDKINAEKRIIENANWTNYRAMIEAVYDRRRLQYQTLLDTLGSKRELRDKDVAVGFRFVDKEAGFVGRKLFPIGYKLNTEEIHGICGFQCIRVGKSDPSCTEDKIFSHVPPPVEPKSNVKADWNFSLSGEQRTSLAIYRETLRDLESLTVQNALDIDRFKRSEGPAQTIDWPNGELARLSLSLQRIREQLNQIAQVEFLASNGQRSPMAAEFIANDVLKHSMRKEISGSQTTEDSLSSWVNSEVAAYVAEAKVNLKLEMDIAASPAYWSIRPALANVWFISHSGYFYPGILRSSRVDSPRLQIDTSAFRLPSSAVAVSSILVIAILGLSIRHFGNRLFVVVSLLSLVLIFPIQSAMRANLSTEKAAEAISNGTIASPNAYPFEQQAGGLANEIESSSAAQKTQVVNAAILRGNAMKAEAFRVGDSRNSIMACAAAGYMEEGNGFEAPLTWANEKVNEGAKYYDHIYVALEAGDAKLRQKSGPSKERQWKEMIDELRKIANSPQ